MLVYFLQIYVFLAETQSFDQPFMEKGRTKDGKGDSNQWSFGMQLTIDCTTINGFLEDNQWLVATSFLDFHSFIFSRFHAIHLFVSSHFQLFVFSPFYFYMLRK